MHFSTIPILAFLVALVSTTALPAVNLEDEQQHQLLARTITDSVEHLLVSPNKNVISQVSKSGTSVPEAETFATTAEGTPARQFKEMQLRLKRIYDAEPSREEEMQLRRKRKNNAKKRSRVEEKFQWKYENGRMFASQKLSEYVRQIRTQERLGEINSELADQKIREAAHEHKRYASVEPPDKIEILNQRQRQGKMTLEEVDQAIREDHRFDNDKVEKLRKEILRIRGNDNWFREVIHDHARALHPGSTAKAEAKFIANSMNERESLSQMYNIRPIHTTSEPQEIPEDMMEKLRNMDEEGRTKLFNLQDGRMRQMLRRLDSSGKVLPLHYYFGPDNKVYEHSPSNPPGIAFRWNVHRGPAFD